MKCLLCSYTHTDVKKIEEHINKDHFDDTDPSPSKEEKDSSNMSCPFGPQTFNQVNYLQSHIGVVHQDNFSPQKGSSTNSSAESTVSVFTCPVCNTFTSTSDSELFVHVDNHFNDQSSAHSNVSNDFLLAQELVKAEEEQLKLNQQSEFELFQAEYGMSSKGNFKEQSIQNLQKAVTSGKLSVVDFYEMKTDLKIAENHGIDDGSSCICDILPRIRLKSQNSINVAKTYLCSAVDFYAASYGDRGWGCGYRNLQMMLSALSRETRFVDLLVQAKLITSKTRARLAMPSISKLQETLEKAWSLGFDTRGRDQLGGKVRNTRKWIGATEIVTVLSSLRFKCRIVDVKKPSEDGLHPKMFEWILRYFQKEKPFKSPLYLQHQGHSRTVVGVEVLKDGEILLLILDPGVGKQRMEKALGNRDEGNSLKLLRESLHTMKWKQFQIAAVIGVVNSEHEYQANKIIENFLKVL